MSNPAQREGRSRVWGIPEPERGAAEWLALEQSICHEAEEDKTVLTANKSDGEWPGTESSSSKQVSWNWGAKRKTKRSLRSEKEGLSLRLEGGDGGALGPELGGLLKCRTTKRHVSEGEVGDGRKMAAYSLKSSEGQAVGGRGQSVI